jgi:ankyrin repeat protein
MKVSKLTAQGYVSAEFTSLDPNNTPLHIACLTHYPKRFILDVLLKGDHLEGIFTENSSGELPIHYAVMDTRGVDTDVLEALIEKFPESVEHRNIDKSLPIHVACQVGAPSLYSIERLLEINPDFSIAQNDLRVPLNDEEMEDSSGWCGALCLDWFATDNEKYVRFETGWTPLHLAAVNGAPPEVIEAIVDANPECMNVRTNKKRTAVECAKNVIIKALLNDVELHKVENTFNAIEVMQSYEKECRLKEELALKAGIVKSALESYEKYGNWWMTATEMLPNREKLDGIFHKEKDDRFDVYDDYGDDDWGDEKGMTNLHRAILKKADPETVHRIIEEWPECLDIKSTYDRTPIDCAKQLIIRGLLNQDPVSTFASTFVSLQVMQAYREDDDESTDEEGNIISGTKNHRKDDTFDATAALSQADVNYLKTRNRRKWGSKGDTYEYMKEFVEMNLVGGSLMGKLVLTDDDAAIQPFDYFPPANLRHVNLRINLPVGFRRLRRALLGQRTDFLRIAVLTERLGCTNITMLPWNKHSKSIGQLRLKKGEKWRDFIGAKKTISYFVPPSEAGDAHMAYESVQIIEYNDYCFAVKAIIKNPDLPYGSEYETHYQIIVIDKGTSNVRMICSSETLITGMKMEDDWQVRNAMRHRMTDFFYALCDAICEHAGSGDKKDQQTDDTELEVDKK